jgi:hypothetical protein
VLRWIGGLDGHHRGGWPWTVGHLAFFMAMVLFAALAVALFRSPGGRRRAVAAVATEAAVAGAGCFLWVIAGDLSSSLADRWPLPDPLQAAGPVFFVLGMVTLLVLRVADRRLPVWSPVLFLAGFVAVSVNLDLLPFGALVVLTALVPLARAAATIRRTPKVSAARST